MAQSYKSVGGAVIVKQVYFSGNTQGVGFRYNAFKLSQKHGITGSIQNLPDGRVFLQAEGNPDNVAHFLQSLKVQMKDFITETEETTVPVSEHKHTHFLIL
jgi:acylphosphatase